MFNNSWFEEWDTIEYLDCSDNDRKRLQTLRSLAAKEILEAVNFYFLASRTASNVIYDIEDEMSYQKYFAHEAADEMLHYLSQMRLISKIDDYQKEEFEEHGLGAYLVDDEYPPIELWYGPFSDDYTPDAATVRWLNSIVEAIKAIHLELKNINLYENFILEENNKEVIEVYIEAMNHEKELLADFNEMLFKLLYTDNPTPPEG